MFMWRHVIQEGVDGTCGGMGRDLFDVTWATVLAVRFDGIRTWRENARGVRCGPRAEFQTVILDNLFRIAS